MEGRGPCVPHTHTTQYTHDGRDSMSDQENSKPPKVIDGKTAAYKVQRIIKDFEQLTPEKKTEIANINRSFAGFSNTAGAQISAAMQPMVELGQKISKSLTASIGTLAESLAPVIKYYEVNRDIIDKIEEWPELTGLTMDQLDQLELHEVVDLIRSITENQYIDAADTLELVVVDAVITPTKQGGAITQAEATRSVYELYGMIPSGSATHLIKKALNNPGRVTSPRRGQIKQTAHYLSGDSIITYKGQDSTLTVTLEQTKKLFTKKIQNGAKVFNFLLEKLNEQHRPEVITFTPQELINKGIYANKDSAVRGLNNVLSKMYAISIEGVATEYSGKIKTNQAYAKSRLIAAYKVSYTNCEVAITPLIRNNTRAITILPNWAYALNDNAYMLLDYIYYLARQEYKKIREDGYFNISLEAIRTHLGLPTPAEAGRYPAQLIQNPIEKAITEIEEARAGADLKITPVYNYDYKNMPEYLSGYLRIELDETARAYMEDRAIAEEKEYRKQIRAAEAAKRKSLKKEATRAIKEAAATIEK